jgi:hypothetical protein
MSRMPGATWQGEQSPRRPMARWDIVCVHTIVGFAPAHAAHFSTRANGEIIQSRDTAFQSAANLDGNHRVISIENEDHGPAFGGTPQLPKWVPLTEGQVEACARILAWAHEQHGVPLQLCPDSRPGSRGLAYHRQGIDGNFGDFRFPGRVSGGEHWSSSGGKVCPTDVRIAQLPKILARAKEIVEGDDMTPEQVKKIVEAEVREALADADNEIKLEMGKEHPWSLARALRVILRRVNQQGVEIQKLKRR